MRIYLVSFVGFFAFLLLFVYYNRAYILPLLPERIRALLPESQYTRIPVTFSDQAAAGLSSSNFDLEQNLTGGDSRTGLDERGVEEIRAIMRQERVNFDDARLLRHQRHMARNGIDPVTGMPLDSKAITRL